MLDKIKSLTRLFKNHARPGTTYEVPGAPPTAIPEGYVKLVRIPKSNFLQIHYRDGSFENFVHSRDTQRFLVKRGLNPYKVEWLVDYLWNYNEVIVRVREPGTWTDQDQ